MICLPPTRQSTTIPGVGSLILRLSYANPPHNHRGEKGSSIYLDDISGAEEELFSRVRTTEEVRMPRPPAASENLPKNTSMNSGGDTSAGHNMCSGGDTSSGQNMCSGGDTSSGHRIWSRGIALPFPSTCSGGDGPAGWGRRPCLWPRIPHQHCMQAKQFISCFLPSHSVSKQA